MTKEELYEIFYEMSDNRQAKLVNDYCKFKGRKVVILPIKRLWEFCEDTWGGKEADYKSNIELQDLFYGSSFFMCNGQKKLVGADDPITLIIRDEMDRGMTKDYKVSKNFEYFLVKAICEGDY